MTQYNRAPKPITIGDILRLAPTPDNCPKEQVSWVNGIFEAYVHDSKPGQANNANYVSMTLLDPSDGNLSLSCTIWGLTVPPVQGTYLTMTGQGIVRKEWEGKAQISGKVDKVVITPIAGPSQTATQPQLPITPAATPAAPPAQTAPAEQRETRQFKDQPGAPGASYPPAQTAQAAPPGTPRFSGPMTGGAVKEAVKIITSIPRGDDFYDSSDFLNMLMRLTSHILRVQERIQKEGKIVAAPGERVPMGDSTPPAGQVTDYGGTQTQPPGTPPTQAAPPGTPPAAPPPPPVQPQTRPEPGQDGAVQLDIDDDVPF